MMPSQSADAPIDDAYAQPSLPKRDSLTGLYQQDYLALALEQALRRGEGEDIAATLGLLQLENFYEIRSWVGKSEANLLLGEISAILKKTLPKKVLLCRCRHYEFGILLIKDCSVNAGQITDRVKQALLTAVSASIPPQLELRCAVGLAGLDSDIASAEVMFARARHNLSLSISQVNQHVEFPTLNPDEALKRLRRGLEDGQLTICYQAMAALQTDGLQHYELRFRHIRGEKFLPEKLMMDAAVKNALGPELDRLCISHALTLLREDKNKHLQLTVNISHNSLVQGSFYYWLESEIDGEGNIARRMTFQLKEIDVLIAQHHIAQFCERLQSLKIKLGICQFGATLEPFRYLSLLTTHSVKLDVSLLERINESKERRLMFQGVVKQLHDKGLKVIAGEVEEFSLIPLLWQEGVDFVQGNCLAPLSDEMGYQFLQEERLQIH